LRSQHFSTA